MTRSTFLAAAFVLAARKRRVRVDSRKVCEALAAPRIDFNRVCEDMKVRNQAVAESASSLTADCGQSAPELAFRHASVSIAVMCRSGASTSSA